LNAKLLIFTDLDGTLLDSDYSFKRALPALKRIKEQKIPLILCSSKTRAEIGKCRKKLGNEFPFIAENGGGIFFPKEFRITNQKYQLSGENDYRVIKLGASYDDLRNALQELRAEGFDLKGFGEMSAAEVAQLTGLTNADAKMAQQRDFDEPFVFYGDKTGEAKLKRRIKAKGFHYTKGEFFHIMGDSDKGRAVEIVKLLYSEKGHPLVTAALGDSPNDIEMLQSVDYPIVVQKKDGSYNPQVVRSVKGCIKADGIGPDGWNRAVLKLITNYELRITKK